MYYRPFDRSMGYELLMSFWMTGEVESIEVVETGNFWGLIGNKS